MCQPYIGSAAAHSDKAFYYNYIINKAYKLLGTYGIMKNVRSRQKLQMIYISFLRCLLLEHQFE